MTWIMQVPPPTLPTYRRKPQQDFRCYRGPMDAVADPALAAWLTEVRAAPAIPPSLAQIRRLRAPRPREAGPGLSEVRGIEIPAREDPIGERRGGGRQAGTGSITDHVPLRARLYRSGPDALSLTVFVHGGGFVFGGLESHDRLCRRLALLAGTAVLAVDYRLAPEHPAPAAVDDVMRALEWVASRPKELGQLLPGTGLAGDSAGGLIAYLAACGLAGTPALPDVLFLAYPNADLSLSLQSVSEKGEGWGLSVQDLAFYIAQWVPDASLLGKFSPVEVARAQPLPVRTLLATAGHDPLRDEGKLLAEELARGGTDVEYRPHPDLVHGFLTLDAVSPAARHAGDSLLAAYGALLSHTAMLRRDRNAPPDAPNGAT